MDYILNLLWTLPEGLGALLGSGVGLIALMIAAIVNAKIERKSRFKEHQDERLSHIAAIRAEIQAFGGLAQRRILFLTQNPPSAQTVRANRKMPDTRVFDSIGAQLGILPAEIVDDITAFYYKLDELRISIDNLNDLATEADRDILPIHENALEQWRRMDVAAMEVIEKIDLTVSRI